MDEAYTADDIRKSKSASLKDGAFWSFMVGTGESSMSAFLLALGAPGGAVGFIQTFPQFFGSLVQLFSLPLGARIKTRKWVVTAGVVLQAACWIPMALLALVALPPLVALPAALLFFTLYFATGMIINPIWAAWMADLVEPNERGHYFAARNRLAVLSLLFSTVLGGLVLLAYTPHAAGTAPGAGGALSEIQSGFNSIFHLSLMQAFALLFFIAFFTRTVSAWYVTRMHEKKTESGRNGGTGGGSNGAGQAVGHVDWMGFITNPALGEERRFDYYTAALYTATYIAAPFFDVYMLTVLRMDYLTWAVISIAGPVARFLALPYWGRVSDRFGNRAVLFVTGFVVPLTPILWMLSKDPVHLFLLQMISGTAWSGLELAAFNYNIAGREPSLRTAQTSAYNFAKGSGYLMGALIGWGLLALWPAGGIWGLEAFMGIFAISTLARYAASLYFLPRFSPKTFEGGMSSQEFFWQVMLVQPGRELTANMMQLSQTGMNLAQAGASATRRAARKGLDLTIYMLKRGPLLMRMKKDRL